jgi:hypothetical protein
MLHWPMKRSEEQQQQLHELLIVVIPVVAVIVGYHNGIDDSMLGFEEREPIGSTINNNIGITAPIQTWWTATIHHRHVWNGMIYLFSHLCFFHACHLQFSTLNSPP